MSHLQSNGRHAIVMKNKTYLTIMLFCKVLTVDITPWNCIIRIDRECRIANLNWQTIFKVQKADLADVFQLAARLADLCLLVPCIPTRSPTEDSKRTRTDLAFLVIFCSQLPTQTSKLVNNPSCKELKQYGKEQFIETTKSFDCRCFRIHCMLNCTPAPSV